MIADPSHRESRDANSGMMSKLSPSSMKRPTKKTKSVSPPKNKLIGASESNERSEILSMRKNKNVSQVTDLSKGTKETN